MSCSLAGSALVPDVVSAPCQLKFHMKKGIVLMAAIYNLRSHAVSAEPCSRAMPSLRQKSASGG